MNERDMRYDGRNPYGSEGGYVMPTRGRGRGRGRGRRDRGMDYGEHHMPMNDMRGRYDMARGDSREMRRDYRAYDMRGHHPMEQGLTYYPVEAMGTFNGYYGVPHEQQHDGRYDNADYGYHMGGEHYQHYPREYRDFGYRGYDYGYDYEQDNERLSEKELDEWCHKLKSQLDDREKQMFSKEVIIPKFKQMGIEMKDFNEEELYVMTLAQYTDHKQSIGQNPDLSIKLARDFMVDKDSNVKGGERLAVYYDTFVAD